MGNKKNVLFSIITPVYNGENYINQAIKSVIGQTFSRWELLIIDDASEDKSLSIIKEWEARDERIKVLQHADRINKGVSVSRNFGIRFVSGEWIAFLDADDYWYPHKLESEYQILRSEKNLALLYSQAKILDTSNPYTSNKIYGVGNHGLLKDPFPKLIKGFQGHISSIVVNKNIIVKNNLKFKDNMQFAEDTLFFHKVLSYGDLFFIPEILSVYRFHNKSSCSNITSEEKILGRFSVYENLLSDYSGRYIDIISFELTNTGMDKIWKNFLLRPFKYYKLLFITISRILKNKKVNGFHKLFLLFGPLPMLIKSIKRKFNSY